MLAWFPAAPGTAKPKAPSSLQPGSPAWQPRWGGQSAGALENHFAQTVNGRSTISHFTFGSFSFRRVKGRRIAVARSTAFTCLSHAHRMVVFSVSLGSKFVIV